MTQFQQAIFAQCRKSEHRLKAAEQQVKEASEFLRSKRRGLLAVRRDILTRVAEEAQDAPPSYNQPNQPDTNTILDANTTIASRPSLVMPSASLPPSYDQPGAPSPRPRYSPPPGPPPRRISVTPVPQTTAMPSPYGQADTGVPRPGLLHSRSHSSSRSRDASPAPDRRQSTSRVTSPVFTRSRSLSPHVFSVASDSTAIDHPLADVDEGHLVSLSSLNASLPPLGIPSRSPSLRGG